MSMLGKRGLCRHDPNAVGRRGKEKVTRLDDVAIWARTLQRLRDGARAVFTASAAPPSAHALPEHAAPGPARPAPSAEFAPPGSFNSAAAPAASPAVRQWWQPVAEAQPRRTQGQAGRGGGGGGREDREGCGVGGCCCSRGEGSAGDSGGVCMRCSGAICQRCVCVCGACQQSFCSNCTITNYDLRVDRSFCLDCSHHC